MKTAHRSMHTALLAGIVFACTATYAAPSAAAEQYRSFYQNAGGNCHGVNHANDKQLARTPQSLQNNTTTSTPNVICNLTTDGYAAYNNGIVTSVYLWARRTSIRSDNATMTCTLTTGFAGDPTSATITQTISLPSDTTSQAFFTWTPASGQRFSAPVNILCVLPHRTELNDSLAEYLEDVGN